MEEEDTISLLKHSFPLKFLGFKINATTENVIMCLIHSLKSQAIVK
jgi:hypothetical protein